MGAITKNIRLHLETNLGVDQRLPLGTCLTVSSVPIMRAWLQGLGPRLALWNCWQHTRSSFVCRHLFCQQRLTVWMIVWWELGVLESDGFICIDHVSTSQLRRSHACCHLTESGWS